MAMKRTGGLAIALFVAWVLEWVSGFGTGVSSIDLVIAVAWLVGCGYFVIASRARLSRTAHAVAWMLAIVAITIVRALWVGWWNRGDGILAEIARTMPPPDDLGSPTDLAFADAIVTSIVIGFVYGLLGAVEAVLVAVFGWIGDLADAKRTPPQVAFLPRLAVVVLQLPVYAIVTAVGLGAVAGVAAGFGQAGSQVVLAGDNIAPVVATGVACCAVATLHVLCLRALDQGSRLVRAFLGCAGVVVAVAVAVIAWPNLRAIVVTAIWCVAQLAALRWARPTRRAG
jgi:hypothetical protein